MTVTPRDSNTVPALLGVLDSTGTSVVKVLADPVTHALKVDNNTTGSDNGPQRALRDENQVTSLVAVSSATTTVNGINYVQGVTPVIVYANAAGELLVDST